MALGLVPKILDPLDVVLAVSEELGMVDAEVVEIGHIQHIVAAPAVGIYDAVGRHFALDDRHQSGPRCVGNDLGINFPTPV